MPRYVVVLVWFSGLVFADPPTASAQARDVRPVFVDQQAASHDGHVYGTVRDDAGRIVAGASVVALGGAPLPLAVQTDATGRFAMVLAAGDYILRATRAGYISTYRELVTIQGNVRLERNIVLVSASPAQLSPASTSAAPAPSEAIWRLRHLAPTALREISRTHVLAGSSRGFRASATSFLATANLTGQVHFLTSSSLASVDGGWLPAGMPHGIAYVTVGAPVGSSGDWTVSGAMSATASTSWVVAGEYTARDTQPHALRIGASYSSQPSVGNGGLVFGPIRERVRNVGGVHAFDRWQVRPALEVEYGLRVDRYDYVSEADFVSPRAGMRMRVLPATDVVLSASQLVVAPGANEFLPPAADSPWLPPERTFSPLVLGSSFGAERVRIGEIGIDHQLATVKDGPTVGIRWRHEASRDQIATVYGLGQESETGHYYVASPGSVQADSWIVRFSGRVAPRVSADIAYASGDARWAPQADAAAIAAIVSSVVRPRDERVRDLTTSIHTEVPETATKVMVAFRWSQATGPSVADALPSAGGRFALELRQALPLRPSSAGRTELVVAVRNLSNDPSDVGSRYDEILTVAPPLRVMGGVQIKF